MPLDQQDRGARLALLGLLAQRSWGLHLGVCWRADPEPVEVRGSGGQTGAHTQPVPKNQPSRPCGGEQWALQLFASMCAGLSRLACSPGMCPVSMLTQWCSGQQAHSCSWTHSSVLSLQEQCLRQQLSVWRRKKTLQKGPQKEIQLEPKTDFEPPFFGRKRWRTCLSCFFYLAFFLP